MDLSDLSNIVQFHRDFTLPKNRNLRLLKSTKGPFYVTRYSNTFQLKSDGYDIEPDVYIGNNNFLEPNDHEYEFYLADRKDKNVMIDFMIATDKVQKFTRREIIDKLRECEANGWVVLPNQVINTFNGDKLVSTGVFIKINHIHYSFS